MRPTRGPVGHDPPVTRIDEVLRRVHGPDMLDIGCSGQAGRRPDLDSPGWLHGRLRRAFPGTVGLEYDPANVAALQAHSIPDVVEGDAQDFSLDRRFDTIVAGEVIEHLERPGAFLTCARRHLKPGGPVVLTTPYAFGFMFVLYAWAKYPRTGSNPEHVAWYCPATISELAERSGLRVEACEAHATYRRDLTRWTARAANLVMRSVGRLLPMRVRANTLVVVLTAA